MLQSGSNIRDHGQALSGKTNDSFSLSDIKTILFRSYRTILAATLVALLVGTMIVLMIPPSYVASGELLIESRRGQGDWQEFGSDVNLDSAEVDSQVEVLRSRNISSTIIDKLNLAADPDFRIPPGLTPEEKEAALAAAFSERLTVRRLGQSNAIEVSFRSSKPGTSARIANAVIDTYLSGQWRYDKRHETLRRFKDDVEEVALAISNARMITMAMTPLGKSSPKTTLILSMAMVVGALLGIGVALARHSADRSIRSEKQMRDAQDIECLASLPRFRGRETRTARSLSTVVATPFSGFSDALRRARVALELSTEGRRGLCIGFVALDSGAGTTTVVANLAALIGASGLRCLVVDANFRNPSLTASFKGDRKVGLIEVLRGTSLSKFDFDETRKCWALPLIDTRRIANSDDFLRSESMRSLLDHLRSKFDIVLVDLPALKTVVDAKALGPFLDEMVIIVEWGATQSHELAEMVAEFETAKIAILGAVLNKASIAKQARAGPPTRKMRKRTQAA